MPDRTDGFANRLIAHRGWREQFPENTLAALRGAIDVGAHAVEIDIQLSADHVPVICHDPTLERLCATTADITQLSAKELAALSAHEPGRLGQRFVGTPLARLADVCTLLAKHPDVTLYAELKRHSLRTFGSAAALAAVLPLLEPLTNRCVVISFDIPVLQLARQHGWSKVGPILSDWSQVAEPSLRALAPAIIFCDSERMPEHFDASALPAPLAIYEVSDYAAARYWLERGAHYLETFRVGELLAASAASSARHAN